MEQAIKGQMGQPAACMIENKGRLSQGVEMLPDYGLPKNPFMLLIWRTDSVDNFVKKSPHRHSKPAPILANDSLMTN